MTGMQVSNDKRLKLVTGRAHPELAQHIADELGIELLPVTAYDFANSEIYVRFDESIRGADVFIVGTSGLFHNHEDIAEAWKIMAADIEAALGAAA